MIIEKSLWESAGGMDERLTRSQDHDLGFRLAKSGYPAKMYNHIFAIHHTVSYFEKKRLRSFIFSDALLSQGLLMRKHITNFSYISRYHNNVLYVIYLLTTFIILFFSPVLSAILISVFFLIQLIRVLKNRSEEILIINSFLYKIAYSLLSLVGLLFYFPSAKVYTVKEINNKV